MNSAKEKIQKLLDLIGFDDVKIEILESDGKVSVFIKDKSISPTRLPEVVQSLTHITRQIAKKEGADYVVVDVNDYRKERESLIVKLARAAAKKAATTKEDVPLPTMNAYERMVVHTELSMRPDVATESIGEDKERHVVVRPIDL